jgi:predicted TIM-barrel fold metal-dependent hydrolase
LAIGKYLSILTELSTSIPGGHVNVEDLVLVSVDDHIIEPREMFDAHIPERFRDRAPRVLTDDDGSEYWLFEDERAAYMGLNAVAGCPPEEYGLNPTRYDQMRKGCFDVDERVRDMNANGVLASLNFPTFPHFCGQLFARQHDKDLSLAVVRAYNDWHIDEWCGAHPGRFIPCGITPYWDPNLMAEEVRRVAEKDCHAVTFSENPEKLGHPSLHSDHWDPFWSACQESETVVCLHIGSSSSLLLTASDAPADVMISITPMNSFLALNDLMWTSIFKKFPRIKIAMSEGGIGWIPYALERMDYVYEHHHSWTGADFGGRRPSDVYRDHIVTCFIDDASGLELRHRVGIDSITWECDYPHSDSTWPHSPELLWKSLSGIPDDEVDKMTHLNAMRVFTFDPFAARARERCTVGALRSEAADVDISVRSLGRKNEGGMRATELAALARPEALDA